jgi:uncharacterized membrane protein YfcA
MTLLLLSLSPREIFGFLASAVGLILAAGGGIGGGGILMPIYILILRFPVKRAIPLVNVTVFGGAVANTMMNVPKRHPLVDRPLIDWDLILAMEPLTMAGALIGALLAKLLPSIILIISLVAVLSFTAYKTLQKAVQLHDKESKVLQQQQIDETTALLSSKSTTADSVVLTSQETAEIELLESIVDSEKTAPKFSVISVIALFFVVVTSNILKGGGSFSSPLNIKCGSAMYWATDGLIFLCIAIVAIFARQYLIRKTYLKKIANYPHVEGDTIWDERTTVVYPLFSMLAGFTAGLFGLGGGIVTGPLMIFMGVHPSVSSATTAVMIFLTSFTATTSFVVFGLLDYTYATFCTVLGFLATVLGQLIMGALIQKFKHVSFIPFAIGIVVAISCILMTIESVLSLVQIEKVETHHQGGLCST